MCTAPRIPAPVAAPPALAAPMTLDQLAPKQAEGSSARKIKRKGLSRYKINPAGLAGPASSKTNKLGGIPKKTGV